MKFNKIFILGAGAIGSVYGAFLSKRNEVTLIGNEAHVHALNSQGLSVSGDINQTFQVKADTEIRKIPQRTLIVLTTKAYDSAEAVGKIRHLLKKDTVILVLQNGLGNKEVVKQAAGGKLKVLRGITTMAAEFFEPGKTKYWRGKTLIEQNQVGAEIAEISNQCGLETELTNSIRRGVWNKLVVNCVVNPLSALFQVRNYEIITDPLEIVRHGIVRECVEVGRAEDVTFPEDLEKKIEGKISQYTNFSSMYQDIMKGKPTEIDFLNGKVVELGKKHRIPTPINETLVCLIKFLEEKYGISRQD